MLLRQLSEGNVESQYVLDVWETMGSCPILNQAQFYSLNGSTNSFIQNSDNASKSKITRSLNEDNTVSGPTPTYGSSTKRIISFDAKVDKMLEQRGDTPDQLATYLESHTRKEAKQVGRVLNEMFHEGDNGADSEDFDGFDNLVDSDYIKTDGVPIPLGGDSAKQQQQEFVEKLLEHIEFAEGATDMYVYGPVRWRMVSLAKQLGYYSEIQRFGQTIPQIGGVNIHHAGWKPGGSYMLAPSGSTSPMTFWIVRWGEGTDLTVLTSQGLVGEYQGAEGNYYVNNYNMDAVIELHDDSALVKSYGWTLATP